jgi:hypothetical protein
MAILSDTEADLAWYFCPQNPRTSANGYCRCEERANLSEREICLLKEQERKTLEETDLSMKLCQSIIKVQQDKIDALEAKLKEAEYFEL